MKLQNVSNVERFLKLAVAREFATHRLPSMNIRNVAEPASRRMNPRPALEAHKTAGDSMALVCGTDFSQKATEAARGAAALAKRLGERLVLVHAVNEHARRIFPEDSRELLAHLERERLHDLQEQLSVESGRTVETSFRAGRPEVVLQDAVAAHHARLLVMAGPSQPLSLCRSFLGSLPERVAEAACVPTLVVRNAASLQRWASGERQVRVLVGADDSAASTAALHWVEWFREWWACELIVACLEANPPASHGREVFPSMLLGEMAAKSAHAPEREFREHVQSLYGADHLRIRYEKGWTCLDAQLVHLAREECVDLIVVGTHSRSAWGRCLHHSVSRGVLRAAPRNVVCVPGPSQSFS